MWKATATTALAGALAIPAALGATATPRLTARGEITLLTQHRIVVRTSQYRFPCGLGAASPDLASYHVGDRVAIVCAGHPRLLVRIAPVTTTAESTTTPGTQGDDSGTTTFGGRVTVLSSSSITVHDGARDLTCAIGTGSPSLDGLVVGDHVKLACTGGVLTVIAKITLPPEPPTTTTTTTEPTAPPTTTSTSHTTTGALGTVSALLTASISVHTDGGVVTCSLGPSSPSLGEVHVGDRVKMYCLDGVLAVIARVS